MKLLWHIIRPIIAYLLLLIFLIELIFVFPIWGLLKLIDKSYSGEPQIEPGEYEEL